MGMDFSKTGAKITLSDIDMERGKKAADVISAETVQFDTSDHGSMVKTLKEYDLVLGALPGDYGFNALKAVIDAGKDMVDVSFPPEDPTTLNEETKKAGITIVPDCGVAPGLSNMLVGYGSSKLDTVEEAKIMVGGIPEKEVPPLGYTITWSADGDPHHLPGDPLCSFRWDAGYLLRHRNSCSARVLPDAGQGGYTVVQVRRRRVRHHHDAGLLSRVCSRRHRGGERCARRRVGRTDPDLHGTRSHGQTIPAEA